MPGGCLKTFDASYDVPNSAGGISETEYYPAMSPGLVSRGPSPLTLENSSQGEHEAAAEKDTCGQILKSSALVGGSSVVNIVIGMVRTKAMAVLLGPAGYGLFGIYGSIANLTQSIAGMGVNSSGVRQIAVAVGSGDRGQIGMTTAVLRRTSIVLGVLGAALLLVFSRQVSSVTFGSHQHAAAVSLLSIAVFLQLVSCGQAALIQGMRRIADLAKMQVLGALFGTLMSIPLVYFLRERGVVPSLVVVSLMSLIFSWWYSRKVHVQSPSMTASQVGHEAAALLKLGLAFMASYFMTMAIAYAVRLILLRKVGFEATGCYQSAWNLGGMYVGFVLQAMAADFYPRLTASAHDNSACNRLVNDQARVGLLLASPGVIATLTFSPVVIALFYSAKFGPAVGALRWICLGTILQVITWPMGFILIAKGRQAIFFAAELAWTVASLCLAWICVRSWGLNGAGIAFFGSYILYGFLIYLVVHRISGFHWSIASKCSGLILVSLVAVVFCGFYVLPFLLAACLGTLAALLSGVYSVRVLSAFVSWDQIPGPVRRLLVSFRPVLHWAFR
jgi:enterobacterial common antigen flippase